MSGAHPDEPHHHPAGPQRPPSSGVAETGPAPATPAPPSRPTPVVERNDARLGVYRRRRVMVVATILTLAALLILVLAFWWPGFARPGSTTSENKATPSASPSLTAPTTPGLTPIERDPKASAFAQALPATFATYALTAEEPTAQWAAAGAGEAYQLTYADRPGADATTITVVAGQWATPQDASTAKAAMIPQGTTPTASGEVKVGKEVVGDWSVVPGPDGTATVTWRNTTAVMTATGPAAKIVDVYRAFPM